MTDIKSEVKITGSLRIWIVAASFLSLVHELVLAQLGTILWGGLIVKYTLAMGIFILALGAGSFFYPKTRVPYVGFGIQQSCLALLGIFFPWVILWVAAHVPADFGLVAGAILIFVIGFVSGFEFPMLHELILKEQPNPAVAILDGRTFFRLNQLDFYGMAIACIGVYFFRTFGIFQTSIVASSGNFLLASASVYKFLKLNQMKKQSWYIAVLVIAVLLATYWINVDQLVAIAQRWLIQ